MSEIKGDRRQPVWKDRDWEDHSVRSEPRTKKAPSSHRQLRALGHRQNCNSDETVPYHDTGYIPRPRSSDVLRSDTNRPSSQTTQGMTLRSGRQVESTPWLSRTDGYVTTPPRQTATIIKRHKAFVKEIRLLPANQTDDEYDSDSPDSESSLRNDSDSQSDSSLKEVKNHPDGLKLQQPLTDRSQEESAHDQPHANVPIHLAANFQPNNHKEVSTITTSQTHTDGSSQSKIIDYIQTATVNFRQLPFWKGHDRTMIQTIERSPTYANSRAVSGNGNQRSVNLNSNISADDRSIRDNMPYYRQYVNRTINLTEPDIGHTSAHNSTSDSESTDRGEINDGYGVGFDDQQENDENNERAALTPLAAYEKHGRNKGHELSKSSFIDRQPNHSSSAMPQEVSRICTISQQRSIPHSQSDISRSVKILPARNESEQSNPEGKRYRPKHSINHNGPQQTLSSCSPSNSQHTFGNERVELPEQQELISCEQQRRPYSQRLSSTATNCQARNASVKRDYVSGPPERHPSERKSQRKSIMKRQRGTTMKPDHCREDENINGHRIHHHSDHRRLKRSTSRSSSRNRSTSDNHSRNSYYKAANDEYDTTNKYYYREENRQPEKRKKSPTSRQKRLYSRDNSNIRARNKTKRSLQQNEERISRPNNLVYYSTDRPSSPDNSSSNKYPKCKEISPFPSRHSRRQSFTRLTTNRRTLETSSSERSDKSESGDESETTLKEDRRSNERRHRKFNNYRRRSHGPSIERNKRPIMQPDKFSGEGLLEDYLEHFEACASLNQWDKMEKVKFLAVSLTGQAREQLIGIKLNHVDAYKKLTNRLQKRYGPGGQTRLYRSNLRSRRQRENEGLRELGQAIRMLARQAYPNMADSERESMAKDYFLDALDDDELHRHVTLARTDTLDDAIATALELEGILKTDRARHRRYVRNINWSDKRPQSVNEQQRITQTNSSHSDERHTRTENVQSNVRNVIRDEGISVTRREQADVMPNINRRYNSFQPRNENESAPRRVPRSVWCYNCGQEGHISRFCPQPQRLRQYPESNNNQSEPLHQGEINQQRNVTTQGTNHQSPQQNQWSENDRRGSH